MNLESIVVAIIVWICVSGFYSLVELYARRRERIAIIEKFGDKFDPSLLYGKSSGFSGLDLGKSFSALKAGCLLLGLGLGLLVGLLISTALISKGYDVDNWQNRNMLFSVAYSSSVLLFGGAGLIAAFVIENKMRNKEKQE
ncbi:MAG: hypothetical protein LBK07_03405 [Tannerella sp.]|jgi:hypothetical protein|nr:hypothetical protein [Tannerella sp.]